MVSQTITTGNDTSKIDFAIEKLRNGERLPGYVKYPGQCRPQYAYLAIDADGSVYVRIEPLGGGCSPREFHGLTKLISIPVTATGDEIANFVESHRALIETVISEIEEYWDGSNFRGWSSDLGDAALDDLDSLAQREIEGICVFDSIENLYHGGSFRDFVRDVTEHGLPEQESDQYYNFDVEDEARDWIARELQEARDDEEDQSYEPEWYSKLPAEVK